MGWCLSVVIAGLCLLFSAPLCQSQGESTAQEDSAAPPAAETEPAAADAPAGDSQEDSEAASSGDAASDPGDMPDGDEGAVLREEPLVLPGLNREKGNCVITGDVSDATNLNAIEGAFIDVKGTGLAVETDAQGKFRIEGLTPGTYTLEASQLGYHSETRVVTAIEAQPATTSFGLRVKPADEGDTVYTFEDEVIVGEYSGDSRGDLFLELAMDSNIVSGIDKSAFSESGIGDAADAVSKISGANIVGGKYAVVRGLGDRYSNTTVNGALISSADPSKKAVQLDLFPTDLLQSVRIYKTFTPNLTAEFAGGLVEIQTLAFPEEGFVDFSYGTNTNENLDVDEFYAVPGRGLGMLGEPNDALNLGNLSDGILAGGYTGARWPPRTSGQRAQAAEAAAEWAALHTSAPMRPEIRKPKMGQDLSLSFGDSYDLGGGLKLGMVFSGTWSENDSVERGVEVGRVLNPGPDGIPQTGDDFVNRSQIDDQYTSTLGYGILGSVGLGLGDRHQVVYTYFKNHRADDEVVLGRKIAGEISNNGIPPYLDSSANAFGAGAYTYLGFDQIQPIQRTLELKQFNGSHQFGDEDHPIELGWTISNSDALEQRPDGRTLYFYEMDFADPRIVTEQGDVYNPSLGSVYTTADVQEIIPPLSQSFRESLETKEEAGYESFDITLPLWHEKDDVIKFSLGGSRFDRAREVRGRLFTYNIEAALNSILVDQSGGGGYGVDYLNQFDSLVDPDGGDKFIGWNRGGRADRLILEEDTLRGNTVRNVDASTDLMAGYFMATADLGKWSFTGGYRYESETRSYEILSGLNRPTPSGAIDADSQDNSYLLPGFLLTRTFGDDDALALTMGWSETVARPTFYEFAPVFTTDQSTGDSIVGNPDLVDTLIANYDLGLSWTPSRDFSLGANLFLKEMSNPIAQAYDNTRKTWVNGETGELQGIELEGRKTFFDTWTISANYAFIDSELTYFQDGAATGPQLVSSTFEGQPEQILNLNLGYKHVDSGWSANLVYNYTGDYLTGVPQSSIDSPIRRMSFESLDFILQKRIEWENYAGVVKFKIGNLLDAEEREIFEGTSLSYRKFKPGRTYSISLECEF